MTRLEILRNWTLGLALVASSFVAAAAQSARADSEEISVVTFVRDKKVDVNMAPDPDFSKVQGRYRVDLNQRGVAKVEAEFKNLPSIFDLPGMYSTYVLWAVSDDGSTTRLGPIPSSREGTSDRDFNNEVTLGSSFGLLLTAEPHYLTQKPSRTVVLRCGPPTGENAGRTVQKKVQFLFSENDYFEQKTKVDKKKDKAYREFTKTPLSLLGAGYAVRLARNAGAETAAPEELNEAETALENAKRLWQQKREEREIDTIANAAIGHAANAEKRAIESRRQQKIEQEKSSAATALDDTEDELRRTKEELERKTRDLEIERQRAKTFERNVSEKDGQINRSDAIASEAVKQKAVLEAENLQLKIELAKLQDEVRRYRSAKEFIDELPALEAFLKVLGPVQKKGNGLTVTLADNYWLQTDSDQFSDVSLGKLDTLARKAADLKFLQLRINSYATAVGDDTSTAMAFAANRAKSLSDYFQKAGVEQKRIAVSSSIQPPAPGKPKKGVPLNQNRIELDVTSIE